MASSVPADVLVDFHLHSSASDGVHAPAEVARRVRTAGIGLAALTDHDTTAGLAECQAAVPEVRWLTGIELTARVRPGPLGTVHVVGLGIDPEHPELGRAAAHNRAAKRAQIEAILSQLARDERIELSWDEVAGDRADDAYVGRNHVAWALMRRGLARERRKAFRRYLQNKRVPALDAVGIEAAVSAIRAAGGLPVFAHPGQLDLEHHLAPAVEAGVEGLEVFRPRAIGRLKERVGAAAERLGLLPGGGSDWHGHYSDRPLGDWRLPARAVAPLLGRLGLGVEG